MTEAAGSNRMGPGPELGGRNSSPGGFSQPVTLSGEKLGIGSFGAANAGDSAATAHASAADATHTPNCRRRQSPLAHLGIEASLKDDQRYHKSMPVAYVWAAAAASNLAGG